jgi:hypothetical protein
MEALEKEYWLEVELQHPKGWSLGAGGGGITKGFFRIDSRTAIKIDVKWEKQSEEKRFKAKVQPVLVVNNFIEDYAKQFRKKTEVHEKGSVEICGHKAYFARWSSDTDIVTISWVCNDENKVFLLNYYLEPDEAWEKVAAWLIPGIVCHTQENFWKYCLFGVEFKIPKEYKFLTGKLTIGRPVLVFKGGENILVIHWCYFAKEFLSMYKDLLEWCKKEIPREVYVAIRGFSPLRLKPDELGKLLMVETERSLIGRSARTRIVKVWHDTDSNRIFLIGYFGSQERIEDFDESEKSIKFRIE